MNVIRKYIKREIVRHYNSKNPCSAITAIETYSKAALVGLMVIVNKNATTRRKEHFYGFQVHQKRRQHSHTGLDQAVASKLSQLATAGRYFALYTLGIQ